jgi:hypothetical protein
MDEPVTIEVEIPGAGRVRAWCLREDGGDGYEEIRPRTRTVRIAQEDSREVKQRVPRYEVEEGVLYEVRMLWAVGTTSWAVIDSKWSQVSSEDALAAMNAVRVAAGREAYAW